MRFILFLALFALTTPAFAKTINVEATFKMSGDNVSEVDETDVKNAGWTTATVNEEKTYTLSVAIDKAKLPYRTTIGDAFLSVSKTGLIQIGISTGDADAGTTASLQWPTAQKKFLVLETPLILKVDGGENASDAWSFDGQATVNYVD